MEDTALQANSLCRKNLLCQKDFVIQRCQQHRRLCEQIIQDQRQLIQGEASRPAHPEALISISVTFWKEEAVHMVQKTSHIPHGSPGDTSVPAHCSRSPACPPGRVCAGHVCVNRFLTPTGVYHARHAVLFLTYSPILEIVL